MEIERRAHILKGYVRSYLLILQQRKYGVQKKIRFRLLLRKRKSVWSP